MTKDIELEGNENFLALTALENYWDTSKSMLFLNEGCIRYSRRSTWGPLRGKVVCSYENRDEVNQAYEYVQELYERILPSLATNLNTHLEVEFSIRYWRIVYGPWLFRYLSVMYDRYTLLKKAITKYPKLSTIGLLEKDYVTPIDYSEHNFLITTDLYNLQIYTRFLKMMAFEFPCKSGSQLGCDVSTEKKIDSKNYIKGVIKQTLMHNGKKDIKNKRRVVLVSSYFPNSVATKLVIKTKKLICLNSIQMKPISRKVINLELRSKISDINLNNDEFEVLLKKLMPFDIPQTLIEDYNLIRKVILTDYIIKPNAILSANAWYYNELFKQWAAESSEQGCTLLGVQHGGNYGCLQKMPSEEHEIKVVDKYYTWGWNKPNMDSKVLPMPSQKLVGRKKIGANDKESGILYVGTSAARHLTEFPATVHNFESYLEWQSEFLSYVDPSLIKDIRVRLHREDHGWDMEQRWKDYSTLINIENWSISFMQSLKKCRLYVCDHASTTFIEALSADKPTILFWDPEVNEIRAEAKQYFDMLHEEGILYYSPGKAAVAINKHYHNVEEWWNKENLQYVRTIFCDQYAKTSKKANSIWIKELEKQVQAN